MVPTFTHGWDLGVWAAIDCYWEPVRTRIRVDRFPKYMEVILHPDGIDPVGYATGGVAEDVRSRSRVRVSFTTTTLINH